MLSLKRVFHRLLGEGGCDEPKESPLRRLGFSRASKSARKWTNGVSERDYEKGFNDVPLFFFFGWKRKIRILLRVSILLGNFPVG